MRVEDILRPQPRAAGYEDPPAEASECVPRVRVGRNHEPDAALASEPGVRIVQIEAIDLTVDLERHAVARRGVDDRVDVDGVRFALQDPSSGRMSQDIDRRV